MAPALKLVLEIANGGIPDLAEIKQETDLTVGMDLLHDTILKLEVIIKLP